MTDGATLSRLEAIKRLGISVSTFSAMLRSGRLKRSKLYLAAEIDELRRQRLAELANPRKRTKGTEAERALAQVMRRSK